jgi:SAM-dependent methyltransferase
LPLRDGSADLSLTMNGFNAFPDKQAALAEFAHVTRPASALLGCFYVCGQRRLTDLFVRHVFCSMGAFAQPFFGKEVVCSQWGAHFEFDCFESIMDCPEIGRPSSAGPAFLIAARGAEHS